MNNPSAVEQKYVVSYTWLIEGKGTRKMAEFREKNDAIRYLKDHIDDNGNLQWSIHKEEVWS